MIPLLIITGIFFLQYSSLPSVSQLVNRLDGMFYDAKVQYLPPWPDSVANIQIVDVDEKSLYEIGRMPWSRQYFTQLNHQLTSAGALVIVYDLLFSEAQPNVARSIVSQWQQSGLLPSREITRIEKSVDQFDVDQQFAASMSESEVVLANLLHHQHQLRTGHIQNSSVQQSSTTVNSFTPYSGYAAPIERFAQVAAGQGFMNSDEDDDGFVRRAALIHQLGEQFYPSLALEAFRVYSLIDQVQPSWVIQSGQAFLEGIKIGNRLIHTDNQGRINIPFRGAPGHYPYTSATDVLNGRIHNSRFVGSIVLVGTSATGLADLRVTPTSLNFPGVEIQATVLDALMSPENIPYRPDWWMGAIALELLVIALLCLLVLPKLGPLASFFTSSLFLLLVLGFNLTLWLYWYLDLPVVSVFLLTTGLAIYDIAFGFYTESSRRQLVKAMFDQYVPPAHIDRLLANPGTVNLAGEKKELSVLFSDIRDFTSISESMSAQELKLWLNQYFTPVTQRIFEHGGTIDKYVGDMVMAFWGAPLDAPDHANKSIIAAFAMLQATEQLNRQFVSQNQPVANAGIGINSGEMNVGDMGSDFRRSYTVIGDAVNLASRLEGLTKFYAVDILVSEYTQQLADKFEFLLVDKVKVKGKHKPVTIYMPLSPKMVSGRKENTERLQNGIQLYFSRDFIQSRQILAELENATDYPVLLDLYLSRIDYFTANPPPNDWDGSYTHTNK